MSKRSRLALAAVPAAVAVAVGASFLVGPSGASTPPEQTITAPAVGGTQTVTWTGTIPAGANAMSDCSAGASDTLNDNHTITINVPPGLYDTATTRATFQIKWTPNTTSEASDEILTVVKRDTPPGADPRAGAPVGSSDTANTTETVVASNLSGGYIVEACGFANALPQAYTGTLTLETKAPEPSLPSSPAQGLAFSASTAADAQRDEAEPNMEIDRAGNIYTCGPTGFSTGADYAQVSTDGGDQFHLIGTPPRGQQAPGGGGDCGLATSPVKNAKGQFTYSYTGLEALNGFSTATSDDTGRTLTSSPQNGSFPGVDRQWQAFTDAQTVLLLYNQQAPRNVRVIKSTNGGLTYAPPPGTSPTDPLGPAQGALAAGAPDFPGPLRTMDASLNPSTAPNKPRLLFFPWNKGMMVNLSVSKDGGSTWTTCPAAESPGAPSAGFVTADSDRDGNVYISYAEKATYHTYLTTLTHDKLANCNEDPAAGQPKKNPGFATPTQVDRDNVRSTVFPWLAASGEPGRVAIAFYGTESDGDVNTGTFKATWNVYVNQSLDALSPTPHIGQVVATSHPFHYDSICLNGLGCDLAVPPGDRSLADFFAMYYNPVKRTLHLVYDQGAKRPDDAAGLVATPVVLNQTAGPSNAGGAPIADPRPAQRNQTDDPTGDALSSYSNIGVTPTPVNDDAADVTSVRVGPEVVPATGAVVPDGGFTVTMRIKDLSNPALQKALQDTQSQSLLWVFRFVNGFRASAVSARWNAVEGFTFGYNDYTTGSVQCAGTSEKCQIYPGDTPVKGSVDVKSGTIVLSVPRKLLKMLTGPTGAGQRPTQVDAAGGAQFFDGQVFTMANASPRQEAQSFMYPLDGTAGMDFPPKPGAGGPGGGGGGPGGDQSVFGPGSGTPGLLLRFNRLGGTARAQARRVTKKGFPLLVRSATSEQVTGVRASVVRLVPRKGKAPARVVVASSTTTAAVGPKASNLFMRVRSAFLPGRYLITATGRNPDSRAAVVTQDGRLKPPGQVVSLPVTLGRVTRVARSRSAVRVKVASRTRVAVRSVQLRLVRLVTRTTRVKGKTRRTVARVTVATSSRAPSVTRTGRFFSLRARKPLARGRYVVTATGRTAAGLTGVRSRAATLR